MRVASGTHRRGCLRRVAKAGLSLSLRVSFRSRKFYPEFAAVGAVGFHSYFAVHSLGGLANDGQADASALVLRVRMNPLEDPKKPALMFRPDADAVVFNPQPDMSV